MSHRSRLLVTSSLFFLIASAHAEDKPATTPADARRATLIRAGYTPVPLAIDPRHLSFDSGSETLIDLKQRNNSIWNWASRPTWLGRVGGRPTKEYNY